VCISLDRPGGGSHLQDFGRPFERDVAHEDLCSQPCDVWCVKRGGGMRRAVPPSTTRSGAHASRRFGLTLSLAAWIGGAAVEDVMIMSNFS
jgi:hypothetical protein